MEGDRMASFGRALLIDVTSRPRLVCASVCYLPQNAAARAGVRHECGSLGSVGANPRARPDRVGPPARGCAAFRLPEPKWALPDPRAESFARSPAPIDHSPYGGMGRPPYRPRSPPPGPRSIAPP